MTSIPASLLPGFPLIESPLFEASLPGLGLTVEEERVARDLNQLGFAVIDFPDPAILDRVERIKARLTDRFGVDLTQPDAVAQAEDLRVQDAWLFDDDVKAIAGNPALLNLLGKLYGRAAFPFQTLNFPVGTQQAPHSDVVHFSSMPERFMCGVWLALEDISADAGPLLYFPGSHRWPLLSNVDLGRRGWQQSLASAQHPFEPVWQEMVRASGIEPVTFTPRKGQALIWSANLLHGGSVRTDRQLTRWSQVTHYYFEDCVYFTPAFSDAPLGKFDVRQICNAATGEAVPNRFLGETVAPLPEGNRRGWRRWFARTPSEPGTVPDDFDPQRYLALNPDVAASGSDPVEHWTKHGRQEGRRYT